MGEGEKFSLPSFPFSPETPDTQARNVSNEKQLIGSMGDIDRTSVFFLFTSTTSTFTNKYDRLWPRKIYCIFKMGKRGQMPMFTSPTESRYQALFYFKPLR